MLKNYITIAFRNLRKNQLYTFLNISGLAVGLAGSILTLLWANDEWSYNKFHPNLSKIHLILQNQTQGGVTYTFTALPGPLAAGLRADFPEIEWATRTSWPDQFLMHHGEKNLYEKGLYAEPDFFKVYEFPVLKGDPAAALRDPGSVVITERTAKKFFGNEDPMGKVFRVANQRDLKVAAVVKDVPLNSTVKFDVILPFHILEQMNLDQINSYWDDNSWPCWVTLHPQTDVAALNAKLENYIQSKSPTAEAHIFAYPLSDWRLYGKFKEGKPAGGRIDLLMMLGIIGLFVLLIACVNFMNLATARSEGRAREVGVRKVIGAKRGLIIGQFLTEAMVITFLGLLLSVVLVKLSLPAFNQFFDKEIALNVENWKIWSSILALGLITGLIAGSYPAIFLSKFKPVRALKGEIITGNKSGALLRKGLVTFQFIISIFLIISTLVIHQQINHAAGRPLGFDADHLISIPARGDMSEKYDLLKSNLLKTPGVKSVSTGGHNLIQFGSNTSSIEWPGKTEDQDFLVSITSVGYDYTKSTGMKVVEGRDFSPEFGNDTMCCLLNQTAVRMMGLKEPVVGTIIRYDTTMSVVGVVEDFVYNDPFATPAPMVVFLSKEGLNHFFVRFENNQHWDKNLAKIEQTLKTTYPEYPVEFHFVKEVFQKSFEGFRSAAQLANVFGGLAIFISCLGLFGLSAFFAEKRGKEISVRKILGAGISSLWFSLSKDFFQPVLLAFVLAVPPAIWLLEKLLAQFEYRIQLSWETFALAGLAAMVITVVTVSFQSIKAALANPIHALRNE
jgi:putative ABC transport system permease protein